MDLEIKLSPAKIVEEKTKNFNSKSQNPMTTGWGIIGCGNIADAKVAPAIEKASNAELIAVMSKSTEKAKKFAKRHNARKFYSDLDAFLSDEKIKAVYIATPPFLHCEQVVKAAKKGKHILCDKPMAMNSLEAKQMIKAAQDNEVNLMIGFMMHFHSSSLKTKDRL